MTDQRNNSTQVTLGEPVSFLELLIGILVRVYLQASADSKVAVSPKGPSQQEWQFRKKSSFPEYLHLGWPSKLESTLPSATIDCSSKLRVEPCESCKCRGFFLSFVTFFYSLSLESFTNFPSLVSFYRRHCFSSQEIAHNSLSLPLAIIFCHLFHELCRE